MLGATIQRRGVRRGRRLLRRRVPLHRRPAGEVRRLARVRHADRRRRHRRRRDRHGALRACGRCVEIQFADYIYPAYDQIVSEARAPALSLGRRFHRADHGAHAVRRRHLRRADAQPESRSAVHARVRPAHGDAVQSVRRQGPADRVDRIRRSGDLPRAEAPLQRPVRRPSRSSRSCRGPGMPQAEVPDGHYTRAARVGGDRPPGQRRSRSSPTARWCPCRAGRGARDRHRRRDHRSAHPRAARHRRRSPSR